MRSSERSDRSSTRRSRRRRPWLRSSRGRARVSSRSGCCASWTARTSRAFTTGSKRTPTTSAASSSTSGGSRYPPCCGPAADLETVDRGVPQQYLDTIGDSPLAVGRYASFLSTRAASSDVRRTTLPSGSSTRAAYGPRSAGVACGWDGRRRRARWPPGLLGSRARGEGLTAPLLGRDVVNRLVEDPLVPERVIDRGLPLAVLPVVRWVDEDGASSRRRLDHARDVVDLEHDLVRTPTLGRPPPGPNLGHHELGRRPVRQPEL